MVYYTVEGRVAEGQCAVVEDMDVGRDGKVAGGVGAGVAVVQEHLIVSVLGNYHSPEVVHNRSVAAVLVVLVALPYPTSGKVYTIVGRTWCSSAPEVSS